MTQTMSYVSGLFAPTQSKPRGKMVWGIDLETIWLPTLVASNVRGDTAISHEALGCPVRLALSKDGQVRFGSNGKPVTRVHKDIANQVNYIKQNMIAELMQYTADTKKANPEAYTKTVTLCREAGKPVAERESEMVNEAIQAIRDAEDAEAKAQAEARAKAEAEAKAKAEVQGGKQQAKSRETVGAAA